RQCNAAVAEIVDQNYRLHKALYDGALRELLKVELYGTTPTPDPRDPRIAELEGVERREQFLTKRVAERGEEIERQKERIAELKAALREARTFLRALTNGVLMKARDQLWTLGS